MIEAARNVACVGGEPLGVTDCLNFGNPEKAEIGWELARAIDGIAAACRALGVPVVSGNVSLYNETTAARSPDPGRRRRRAVEDSRRVPKVWSRATRSSSRWRLGHARRLRYQALRQPGAPQLDLDRAELVAFLGASPAARSSTASVGSPVLAEDPLQVRRR